MLDETSPEGEPTPQGDIRKVDSEPWERNDEGLNKREREIRESEIKANVEFWKSLGVEVEESDVREKIESLSHKEGYDFYIYMSRGLKMSEIWEKIGQNFSLERDEKIGDLDQIKEPRSNQDHSYVVACKYKQGGGGTKYLLGDEFDYGPDADDEMDKSAEEWEEQGHIFISPSEYLVAFYRWFRENSTRLDKHYFIGFPGSRTQNGGLPVFESPGIISRKDGGPLKLLRLTMTSNRGYGGLRNTLGGVRKINC